MVYIKPLTNQLGQDIYDASVWQTCLLAIQFQFVVHVGQNHKHHGSKIQIIIDSKAFNSMMQKHGLFSFSCRVFYRLSLFVHNVLNQDNVLVLRDWVVMTHHYSLRHTQRLHVVVPKRACDDLNFFIFGPKFINFLYIVTIHYSFTDF